MADSLPPISPFPDQERLGFGNCGNNKVNIDLRGKMLFIVQIFLVYGEEIKTVLPFKIIDRQGCRQLTGYFRNYEKVQVLGKNNSTENQGAEVISKIFGKELGIIP